MIDSAFENEITSLLIKYRGIQSAIDSTRKSIDELSYKIDDLKYDQSVLKMCKPIIDDLINKFSDSLLKKLESLLTVGLKQIFFDRNYSIKIRVVEKRNVKCVEILLDDNGNLIPVKDSNVAGGILVVIASIIQIFYIINLPNVAKAMFLDEQFSQLSKSYIPKFMEFLHNLCDDTGLSIVLITHDPKFMLYSDRTYFAEHGKFTLKDSSDYAGD